MTLTEVFNLKGEVVGKIKLPEEIFGLKVNESLISQAVRVYLANQRTARAKAKTRGEVRGSGRKIWRQKGTGRARHGDRYAPIFVGGGVAHGPTGNENYKLKMPKKMRRLALFSGLSSKAKADELIVIEGLEKIEAKTKKLIEVLKVIIQSKNGAKKQQSKSSFLGLALVLPAVWENVVRAGRNIDGLSILQAKELNTYQVLKTRIMILTKPSIQVLKEIFLNSPIQDRNTQDDPGSKHKSKKSN